MHAAFLAPHVSSFHSSSSFLSYSSSPTFPSFPSSSSFLSFKLSPALPFSHSKLPSPFIHRASPTATAVAPPPSQTLPNPTAFHIVSWIKALIACRRPHPSSSGAWLRQNHYKEEPKLYLQNSAWLLVAANEAKPPNIKEMMKDGLDHKEIKQILDFFIPLFLKALSGVIALFLGIRLAKSVQGTTHRIFVKSKMEETLAVFLSNMAYYSTLALSIVFFMTQVGVETASLLAVLGSLGLAIGLSLQGSLSNIASGVMLLLFRPFKLGDFVKAGGESGTVKEIQLFSTVLTTPDNLKIVVPNNNIFGSNIINYSAMDKRRIDMVFSCSYSSDIHKAKKILIDILDDDPRILKDPAPVVWLGALGESSIDFWVRPWVKASEYWLMRDFVTTRVFDRFQEEGISIPFPSRELFVTNVTKATIAAAEKVKEERAHEPKEEYVDPAKANIADQES